MNYIFISAFCVAPGGLKYDGLCLFAGVLSSDNSIICFRRKAFLKSDTLAGFTTSVALIWYIEFVISSKLHFYSNLFEFGAAFSLDVGQVGRYRPTYPREVKIPSCNKCSLWIYSFQFT